MIRSALFVSLIFIASIAQAQTKTQVPFIPQTEISNQILNGMQMANSQPRVQQQAPVRATVQPVAPAQSVEVLAEQLRQMTSLFDQMAKLYEELAKKHTELLKENAVLRESIAAVPQVANPAPFAKAEGRM